MKVSFPSGYGQPSRTPLPATKTRAFSAHSYRESTYRFLWHHHPEWEIVFIHNGRGTRHIGSSVEQFGPGDLVLLPGNVPHTWFSGKEQKGGIRCTVVHFLPQVWGKDFWELPEMLGFQELCKRAQRGLRFEGRATGEVGRRMEALARNASPSLTSLISLLSIFELLPQLTFHSLHAMDEANSGWQNPRLDSLLEWIERRLGSPVTQQEAAAQLKMTPAGFSRWFKSHMGCVFNRYLNEIRVAHVCAEIASGQMSISEAAFRAGYNNLSNFNRRFLEITGLTPLAFRLQIQAQPTQSRRN